MPRAAMQYVKRRPTTKDFTLVLLVQNLGRSSYQYNSHMQWSHEKMRATVGVPKPLVCLYPGVNRKATRLDDVFDIVVPYDVYPSVYYHQNDYWAFKPVLTGYRSFLGLNPTKPGLHF